MPTMIQIRNVPDDLHRQVKASAALSGMSMSEFILRELRRALERPSRAELLERIARLPEVDLEPPAAALVRAERARR